MPRFKIRVNDDFDVSKVVISNCRQGTWKQPKEFDDVELQALLDEGDSQTQKQLAE